MAAGLDRIRSEFEIPDGFPAEVDEAAQRAVGRAGRRGHVDRTEIEFATIDPAGATDLDQAFAIEMDGRRHRAALRDRRRRLVRGTGRPARRRGVESRRDRVSARPAIPVVPGDRCRRARPACCPMSTGRRSIFVVRVDQHGGVSLDGAERAIVRSRAKLAYETCQARRSALRVRRAGGAASRRPRSARNAARVEFPEQEIDLQPDDGFELRYRPRSPAEEQNAALSLAANLAVADALLAARTGLFRVMPEVDDARAATPAPHGAGVRPRLAEGCAVGDVPAFAPPR